MLIRLGGRKEWGPVGEKKRPMFRYEQMWERVESLKDTVEKSWRQVGDVGSLQEVGVKLSAMQQALMN